MTSRILMEAEIPKSSSGVRLDQIAVELFPDYSRSRIQSWIKEGSLLVDGHKLKPHTKVIGGERLIVDVEVQEQGEWLAQAMPLDIIYEDESILVVNKPENLVVHPAAGNYEGTLLNGLLHYCPSLGCVPRAGIVHRLDKDTTGLMVVAKTIESQNQLVKQLQARTVGREYHAIVCDERMKKSRAHHVSCTKHSGHVDANIGRHPSHRTKMAVVEVGGKEAITYYQTVADYGDFKHLKLKLETGRTHQIRVHMSYIGFPLLGDEVYGKKLKPHHIAQLNKHTELNGERQSMDIAYQALASFSRQALHAAKLSLIHPVSGESMVFQAHMPTDMSALLDHLAVLCS